MAVNLSKLKTLCQKFESEELTWPEKDAILDEMFDFVPAESTLLLTLITPSLSQYLWTAPKTTRSRMLDLLVKIVSEQDLGLEPLANVDFIEALLSLTGVDTETEQFDMRVIRILGDKLVAKFPFQISEALTQSPESIDPLLKGCEKIHNRRVESLLHSLFILNSGGLTDLLVEQVEPFIKRNVFSTALTIDLMSASARLVNKENFEAWITRRNDLTMSDIQHACHHNLCNELWTNGTVIELMYKTPPAEDIGGVTWIHEQTLHDFTVPAHICKSVCDDLVHPKFEFKQIGSLNTRDTYNFCRLYILSLCDPKDASAEGIEAVAGLISSKTEIVSGAAMQVMALWASKYNFVPSDSAVVKVAAEIGGLFSPGLSLAASATLMLMAKTSRTAEAIISADKSVRFTALKNDKSIMKYSWAFPHFRPLVTALESDPCIYDQDKALCLLDVVCEWLGIGEPGQDPPE